MTARTAQSERRDAAGSPAARARAWLHGACLPFWAARAGHPRGGFRERIALDGTPLDDDVSRVRVQARQTYLFARAALMGWRPETARALVRRGVAALTTDCARRDGLVGRMVRPGLELADPQPELYDNAFAIMALAWAARALDDLTLIECADAMLARLDETHAHPAGGYRETLPERLPRRQNPHMHLFEASLALAEATGAARHVQRANALLVLFETRFLDQASGAVRERFDDRLAPIAGDTTVEPGHAFEWVALLHQHARLMRAAPPAYVAPLYESALRALDTDGFAPIRARVSGEAVDASRRTWSQTEALRAHLARASAGDMDAAERARALFDGIFRVHLDPAPAGAWIDHYDADGRACVDSITAATGYHLVTAFAEVMESPSMATGMHGDRS